jgi:uncharacterized membrane protein YphA (DoxX/SURF4 family)
MKITANISRILVGLVFVFSGFVKGVDPLGFTFRTEDYFIAYGMDWASPLSLFLTIFLCTIEFTLGVALLLNLRLKSLSWLLLLMMIFFTILTFWDALYNPVPDCGCFGDAVKLTNWETFYKNVVLIILVAIIFFYREKFWPWLTPKAGNIVIMFFAVCFAFFSWYQYRHLPWIDFLPWKTGTNLKVESPGIAKIYLTYRNKVTGEKKEYLSPDYPWNDSTWVSQWEFVGQRVDDSGVAKKHTLKIFDAGGNDFTETIINNPGYQFLVVSYSLEDASRKGFEKIDRFDKGVNHDGHSLVVLTGSQEDEIKSFQKGLHPDIGFYQADDVELKMMIRANPGIILMKDGVILAKWHYRDLPDYEKLKMKYPDL